MCLTNFDNVNTTHCFSCKQRIGNLGAKSQTRDLCRDQRDWTAIFFLIFFLVHSPVRFVFRDSL